MSFDPHDPAIESAASEAQRLADQLGETDDLSPAFRSIELALERYEADSGGTVDELLPPGVEPLAFRLPSLRRGEEFAKKLLCNSDNDIRVSIEAAMVGGMPMLISTIVTALAFPVAAIPVAGSVAVVVSRRGVKGFCKEASEAQPPRPEA